MSFFEHLTWITPDQRTTAVWLHLIYIPLLFEPLILATALLVLPFAITYGAQAARHPWVAGEQGLVFLLVFPRREGTQGPLNAYSAHAAFLSGD